MYVYIFTQSCNSGAYWETITNNGYIQGQMRRNQTELLTDNPS